MPCDVCQEGIDPAASIPNIQMLRAFVVVAACGSIPEAAELLGTSGDRVGQQLTGLEKHMGMKLFNRNRNSTTLTHVGMAIAPNLRQSFMLLYAVAARFPKR